MAQTISAEILRAALAGLRLQEQKIQEQIAEVEGMLGVKSGAIASTEDASTGKRRQFSAASRRKMALAQKARWAAIRGTSEQPETSTPAPTKAKRRKMSAAGRKAVGDATRARWAAKRAAESAPAKKVSKKSMGRAKKVSAKAPRVKSARVKLAAPAVSEATV